MDILPAGLAPICIEDHDSQGRPVNLEWIERGVKRSQPTILIIVMAEIFWCPDRADHQYIARGRPPLP